jgi:prevent-host-death family protein
MGHRIQTILVITMKTASVTELKAHLSRYLRMVRRGSEVQILERGVPIARLVGLEGGEVTTEKERLDRLERAGIVRRGASDLRWLAAEAPIDAPGADVAGALANEREDRV